MPTWGALSPGFGERYGAGYTLIRRVYESLSAQMGSLYQASWPPRSPFEIETFAIAKAIALEGYGSTQRLKNNFNPRKAQLATGMLQRWERIFGLTPLPTDTERDRQARLTAAWLRNGVPSTEQPMRDALSKALGPIFVDVIHQNISSELAIINGIGNVKATGTSPFPVLTCTGTAVVPAQMYFEITSGGPLAGSQFKWSMDNGLSFVQTGQTTAATFPLLLGSFPLQLSAHFGAGTYIVGQVYRFIIAPHIPWLSTIMTAAVEVDQTVAGYHNADGSPNSLFYQTVAGIFPLLDDMLPGYTTFWWFVRDSTSARAFKLDEPNLDLEVLT